MDAEHDIEAARAAADDARLGAWVADFLASPGSDNADLADQLAARITSWEGPVRIEFDRLHRLAGPPDAPALDRLDEGDLDVVDGMVDSVRDGWEPPPAIVTLHGDQCVVEDGNHRIEALRRSGRSSWWCVIGFQDDAERERFEATGG